MPGRIVLKKQSKYRNVRTLSHGIWFQSKREAARYDELKILERAGRITKLRRQVPYKFVVNGVMIGTYKADFVYVEGAKEIVEDAKGFQTLLSKWQFHLMAACFGIEVREV